MRCLATLSALLLAAAAVHADTPKGPSAKHEPGKHIDFFVGDKIVGRYLYGDEHAKPHFQALHSPNGAQLTRTIVANEKDHPHQQAMWFTHGDVIPEGIELKGKVKGVEGVDFWAMGKDRGVQRLTFAGVTGVGPEHVTVTTKNEWRTADGQKLLDETRIIQLIARDGAWLFVFDIDLYASACTITFGDTKEGSFGVRVHPDLNETAKKGGGMENAEGVRGEKEIRPKKSLWVDYAGTVDGKAAGIAIFDHAKNAAYARWHVRGSGLMAANPFVRKFPDFPDAGNPPPLLKLAKGDHLKLRYGLLLHDGDTKAGKVADHYAAFVKVEMK